MAGRGLQEDEEGYFMMPDDKMVKVHPPAANVKYLIDKIDEISTIHIDQALYEAENIFKNLCVDHESMKDVMLNLHYKALSNPKFGEKYVMVLGQVSNYVVDNIPVRSELLTSIENDFKIKETMFQSDSTKFINAVILLGNVYNIVKIRGVPLKVLAAPMLEYLNLLLEGNEEHHKAFAIQILLNGEKIFRTESLGSRLELLKQGTRRTLITRDLNSKSKCWILLALDYMSNDLKPLSEELRNFYLESLGDDQVHVQSLLKYPNSLDNALGKCGMGDSNARESDDVFKDIENLTIPPEMLNVVSTRLKPSRFHRYGFGSRMKNINEKEVKNANMTGAMESSPGTYDDDDMYGIQIERDRIKRNFGKRN